MNLFRLEVWWGEDLRHGQYNSSLIHEFTTRQIVLGNGLFDFLANLNMGIGGIEVFVFLEELHIKWTPPFTSLDYLICDSL